jgi:hypothetical protein
MHDLELPLLSTGGLEACRSTLLDDGLNSGTDEECRELWKRVDSQVGLLTVLRSE